MFRITENELILPSLKLLSEEESKKLSTADLIVKLRDLLKPTGDDLVILNDRSDDRFSQKVRNLRSHRTLEKNDYTTYNFGVYNIEPEGEIYLKENKNLLNEIIPIDNYYKEFEKSIDTIKKLCEQSISSTTENYFFNLLYSSTITTLETYLSDALKYNLSMYDELLQNFVSSYSKYEKEKVFYRNIFKLYENVLYKAKKDISKISFHNLDTIKDIYKGTFCIDFDDTSNLLVCVSIRHDIVHRNGKTVDEVFHTIDKSKVLALCDTVIVFIKDIEDKVNAKIISLETIDSD